MTCELRALCVHALDPDRLATFWAEMLGWTPTGDGRTLAPTDDTGFLLRFLPTDEPKLVQNRMHFDLTTTTLADQRARVAAALEAGAAHVDIGQRPEEPHVVLADPEGNEFCVIEPGNRFLADCGFVGALACDGSQQVGYFWSAALAWPLVWDQDQETAIRSPHGGPKITWGGPPLPPKLGRGRLHLDLSPGSDGHGRTEVDRLVSLGATVLGAGSHEPGAMMLADPDGNEFCVLAD